MFHQVNSVTNNAAFKWQGCLADVLLDCQSLARPHLLQVS